MIIEMNIDWVSVESQALQHANYIVYLITQCGLCRSPHPPPPSPCYFPRVTKSYPCEIFFFPFPGLSKPIPTSDSLPTWISLSGTFHPVEIFTDIPSLALSHPFDFNINYVSGLSASLSMTL